jgi:hypothetical protein
MDDRPDVADAGSLSGPPPEHEAETADRPDSATYLGHIDPSAPVSGHIPAAGQSGSIAAAPEHDWRAAAAAVMPLIRPAGTTGMPLAAADSAWLEAEATRSHSNQVIVDTGPAGLVVVYALPANGFDVIVNGDHLVSWRVDPATLRAAAMANLAAWSAAAPWSDEVDGERRVLSSETGDGWDASRILLPEVRRYIARELGVAGRVLIGVPERHLLVAAALHDGDSAFGPLFAEFVLGHADGAEEPIDRRVFELAGEELVARNA